MFKNRNVLIAVAAGVLIVVGVIGYAAYDSGSETTPTPTPPTQQQTPAPAR
jgi:hypothetical protein